MKAFLDIEFRRPTRPASPRSITGLETGRGGARRGAAVQKGREAMHCVVEAGGVGRQRARDVVEDMEWCMNGAGWLGGKETEGCETTGSRRC